MWTNDESVEYPQVLAGHTVSSNDFRQLYVDPLLNKQQGNIVLFVQDKLSVADISHYANVYGYDVKDDAFSNVKSLMSDLTSTHLPNVLSPQTALTHLNTLVLSAPYDLSTLSLVSDVVNVIVVSLPSTKAGDYVKSLTTNDEIIGSVSNQLSALTSPYYAIYTAIQSTMVASQSLEAKSPKRNLLAANMTDTPSNETRLLTVEDVIYLYMTGLSMSMSPTGNPSSAFDISQLHVNETESYCSGINSSSSSNDSCVMSIQYSGSDPLNYFALKFSFDNTHFGQGYWVISRLEMTFSNKTGEEPETVDLNFDPLSLRTPMTYSFSCSHPDWLVPKNKTQGSAPYISFIGLQVQAFGIENSGFGPYNDCEGFFGVGVWMALISLAVMIAILVFGLIMLSDITTMDRYDDPKGKTIIVATGTD